MKLDDRIDRLMSASKKARAKNKKILCLNCGASNLRIKKDRCPTCYNYRRYHNGPERIVDTKVGVDIKCTEPTNLYTCSVCSVSVKRKVIKTKQSHGRNTKFQFAEFEKLSHLIRKMATEHANKK